MTSRSNFGSSAVEPVTRPLGHFSGLLTGPVFKTLIWTTTVFAMAANGFTKAQKGLRHKWKLVNAYN